MKYTELEALSKLRSNGVISEAEFEEQKRKLLHGSAWSGTPLPKVGIVIVALAAISSLIWYFGSPHWTLYQLDAAIEEGDGERVIAFFDIEAVKADLKEQFAADMAEEVMENDNPFVMMGLGLADRVIDTMVNRTNLIRMFESDFQKRGGIGLRDDISITRLDFDSFKASAGGGELRFTRDGLGWKISGFSVPNRNSEVARVGEFEDEVALDGQYPSAEFSMHETEVDETTADSSEYSTSEAPHWSQSERLVISRWEDEMSNCDPAVEYTEEIRVACERLDAVEEEMRSLGICTAPVPDSGAVTLVRCR